MSAEGAALTFKYDHNGLRTQKIVQTDWLPETTNYFLHGKLLTHMTVDYTDFDEVAHTDKLHFFYDAQSRPAQVSFNGIIYTYAHNLQGDIVSLLDNSGTLVVEYKYDVWGKPIATTGNLADTLGKRNPFRYRGYVYDEETGLYYLRSRYYNPVVGRFVNADSVLIRALLMPNGYVYCSNNPIAKADCNGCAGYYSVYLNVYSDDDYKNQYGHYDISILSTDINGAVTYEFGGNSYSVDMLTFSYGPSGDGNSSGSLVIFKGCNRRRVIPTKQYVLFDDMSQDELDAFMRWLTNEFIDVNTMKYMEEEVSFDVKDSDFKQYDISSKKYCGSAAMKLVANMRKYNTRPFSPLASKVMSLFIFFCLEPRYVYAESTAQDLFDAFGMLFKEVT